MEIVELKNTVTKVENSMIELNSRLEMADVSSEIKKNTTEITQCRQQRANEQGHKGFWDYNHTSNIGVWEEKERKGDWKSTQRKIAENFPHLIKIYIYKIRELNESPRSKI